MVLFRVRFSRPERIIEHHLTSVIINIIINIIGLFCWQITKRIKSLAKKTIPKTNSNFNSTIIVRYHISKIKMTRESG